MRPALVWCCVASACGPKPTGSWIEHDLERGSEVHASRPRPGASGTTSAIDVATLDPAAIDALDEATARAALARLGDSAPAGRLALRVARLAWHRGDDAIARAMLARAASAADHPEIAKAAALLAARLAVAPVDVKTVAVLLPRSGRFSSLGHELEIAVRLAPAAGTRWVFLDTRGEPEGASAAVDQAIARGAVAILGPVGEREGIAAARAAALGGIPIALLSPADGADPASGVFRVVDSPGDEGRAIARLAASESFPTVAVFAPRDDVGAMSAEAFVVEARRLGLQVTGEGTYDPTGGNLEPDVKAFLNLDPTTNPRLAEHLARRGRKKGWATFTPDIAYSLLYVPDRYDRAALVAAFLPYFNVELRTSEFPDLAMLQRKHDGVIPQVVQLVGGAGWNDPTLPIRGGSAVQGAMIVDTFAGELGGDTGAAFAEAFRQRTQRGPGGGAAQTRDAAALLAQVRAAIGTGGSDPRAAFRDALARARLDDGACGPAQMGPDGELARTPVVLEVVGDHLEAVP